MAIVDYRNKFKTKAVLEQDLIWDLSSRLAWWLREMKRDCVVNKRAKVKEVLDLGKIKDVQVLVVLTYKSKNVKGSRGKKNGT